MSDEQRDAAVIAAAREVIKGYESEGLPGQYVGTGIGLRMTHQFNLAALRLAALRTIDRLTAERDAARAEVERLRAACSRKEDVYPTETVITRSASDLLVEFSQFAFFLGDIRKSKEASYRAQYIRAALNDETEADHD